MERMQCSFHTLHPGPMPMPAKHDPKSALPRHANVPKKMMLSNSHSTTPCRSSEEKKKSLLLQLGTGAPVVPQLEVVQSIAFTLPGIRRSARLAGTTVARSQLSTLGDGADLELLAVLLQDVLVVVLPEGLGGVLAGEALEDLGAAGMLLEELYKTLCQWWVFIKESRNHDSENWKGAGGCGCSTYSRRRRRRPRR